MCNEEEKILYSTNYFKNPFIITMHMKTNVEGNGWWILCFYKEDRARAFKNSFQSLQYPFKSLQFLMFADNSLKIMAAEC